MGQKTIRIAVADATGHDVALISELLAVCGFVQYEVTHLTSRRAAIEALTGSHYDCCFVSPEANFDWNLDCAIWDAMEGRGPEPVYILSSCQPPVGWTESIPRHNMHCAAVVYAVSNAMRRRARRVTRPMSVPPTLSLAPSR